MEVMIISYYICYYYVYMFKHEHIYINRHTCFDDVLNMFLLESMNFSRCQMVRHRMLQILCFWASLGGAILSPGGNCVDSAILCAALKLEDYIFATSYLDVHPTNRIRGS